MVDGHGGGDFIERDAVKEGLHVVEAVYCDAALSHLAPGEFMVGVDAFERGEVKSYREPRLPVFQ